MQTMACSLREIKLSAGETEGMVFEGYGAVFNNVDSYGDVILPGAFKQFIKDVSKGKQQWPAMLSQHGGWGMAADDITPVGIWVDLEEDDHGLKVKGKLADTPRGKDLYQLMKMQPRPAIDGLSIGYFAREFENGNSPDEPRRTLKKIDLLEISPVTFPANGEARVGDVKSLDDLQSLAEIECYLREAGGFSRNESKGIIARIKRSQHVEVPDELSDLASIIQSNTKILQGN